MYLSSLKNDLKKLFLNFAYIIAKADGEFSSSEKELLESYCNELQLKCEFETLVETREELIEKMRKIGSEQDYRIIIFEAVGLAMSDGEYSDSEKVIIKDAQGKFGLSENFEDVCELLIGRYLGLQSDINNLILEN